MIIRCLLTKMLILILHTTILAQREPTFNTFQGTVYDSNIDDIKNKFGNHVYDWPVLNTLEWDSIYVSDRDTDVGFQGVEKIITFGIVFMNTMTIHE